jgi:hypothetical protein
MLTNDALRTKPTLTGRLVVLRPLGPEHADAFWSSLHDPEVRRLTGTHTEFRRDQIDVYAFNTRAIRTYERLGFTHEGRARQALHWEGERHDALRMSLLRPEWDAARGVRA